MTKLSDDEVKKLSVEILRKVSQFCEQHGICYSLAYGTLLGAVRHKGFIPWDDDIDIMMPRGEYEKFLECFNDEDGRYKVWSSSIDKNYPYPFAKIEDRKTVVNELGYDKLGVAIDLFPIDMIPADGKEAEKLLKLSKCFWMSFMVKSMKWSASRPLYKNIMMLMAKVVLSGLSYNSIHKMMNKIMVKKIYPIEHSNMACLFGPYGVREIMPQEVYDFAPPQKKSSNLKVVDLAA